MKSVIIYEYNVRQQAGRPEFNIQYVGEFASRQTYTPDNVYDILLLLLLLGQSIIAVSYVETQYQ
jgi:putative effector of murein hydrolase LrgA (UPF0299 family)